MPTGAAGPSRLQELCEQFFELSPNGHVVVSADGSWLAFNDAFCRIVGYTREQLAHLTWKDITPPEDVAGEAAFVRGRLERGCLEQHYAKRYVRKDGSIVDVELRLRAQLDGDGALRHYLVTVVDLGEQLRAEQALRESEARYRLITENLADVIWTTDLAMNPTFISPSVFRLRGYTVEEALALPIERVLAPESLQRARAAFAEEFAREGRPGVDPDRARSIDLEEYRKDGSTVWTENEISFLRDAEGRAVGFVGVTRDVTQRRLLEEQLRQAQKMEAVGQLAGGVAHDFNNLLQVMTGYAELAMARFPAGGPAREELNHVLLAGERAAKLVAQLLAFGRRQPIVREAVDVTAVLRETATMLRRVIGEHIVLESEFDERLPRVLADRGQLEQVLLNICLNARDAMPSGGVLRITTSFRTFDREDAVERPWAEAGSFVRIAVTDTGSGMPPEVLEHLFEPFFTTKEAGKGSGLGMAMVYGVVRQHEGLIHVDSAPGSGTTVEVYFPVVTPAG